MNDDLACRNKLVVEVATLLAVGDYKKLEEVVRGKRLSASEMKAAVEEYGRHLLPLPLDAEDRIDYVAYDREVSKGWSVVLPLYTKEEGWSDLSLELSLIAAGPGKYEVEIDSIHVQ